jgi:hypothetical protein
MIVNSLLARYKGGFSTDTDATSIGTYGRREGYLSLTEISNTPNVGIATDRYLSRFGSPFSSITARLSPTSTAATPYIGQWHPGATITVPRPSTGANTVAQVRAITMSEDDTGNVVFAPELLTLLETRAAQTDLYLRRLGEGTLNGRAAAATVAGDIDPDMKSGKVQTWDQVFSQETVSVNISPDWVPSDYGRLLTVNATMVTPGTTATTLQILVNSVPVSLSVNGSTSTTLTMPAGRYNVFGMATTQVDVSAITNIRCSTTAVGSGAAGLAVRVVVGEA